MSWRRSGSCCLQRYSSRASHSSRASCGLSRLSPGRCTVYLAGKKQQTLDRSSRMACNPSRREATHPTLGRKR